MVTMLFFVLFFSVCWFVVHQILVMQLSHVVYCGISHETLGLHEPLGECVYPEITRDSWDIPWNTKRERYISILHHAIVANIINATYA